MNKLLGLALVAALPLTACSNLPMASTTTKASDNNVAVAGEQYCFKRNLVQSDGKLYCNWVSDRNDVCSARTDKGLEVARYGIPQPAGRCETGEYLMKVAPKA